MILYNIGNTYLILGKPEKSIDYLYQSLEIENRQNPQNQKRRSEVVNSIAKVYLMQKNLDKGEAFLKEYLSIESKLENPNLVMMSVDTFNLGVICNDQGRFDEALKYFKDYLNMTSRYGNNLIENGEVILSNSKSNHDFFESACEYICKIYYKQNKYKDAIIYYKYLLDILNKKYPIDERKVAKVMEIIDFLKMKTH